MIQGKFETTTTEDGYRIVKAVYMGDKDVRTADEVSPWGIDSNPVAAGDFEHILTAYSDTTSLDDKLNLGYVYKGKVAAPGETRLFSVKEDGGASQYIWLKNDETIEIGGDSDNMVRYSELETAFNELKADHNDLVGKFNTLRTAYLAHSHATAPTGPISPPTSGPTQAGTDSAADITPAKIDEIKTL